MLIAGQKDGHPAGSAEPCQPAPGDLSWSGTYRVGSELLLLAPERFAECAAEDLADG
jgi:hypothetical protein